MHLQVYFSHCSHPKRRVNLTVLRSQDGGRTWPDAWLVQKHESKGYSSIAQAPVVGAQGGILFEPPKASSEKTRGYNNGKGCIDFTLFPLYLGVSASDGLDVISYLNRFEDNET